jgi:hypothetical protein
MRHDRFMNNVAEVRTARLASSQHLNAWSAKTLAEMLP